MSANDDQEVWQAYTQGIKSKASRWKTRPKKRDTEHNLKITRKHLETPLPPRAISTTQKPDWLQLTDKPLLLDRKKERALRDGSIPINGKLDLHGMTQNQAYAALDKFMAQQVKRAHRYLLVITGKGSLEHSILRQNVPQWLETLPSANQILSLRQASVKHGGSGAFYVILKRRRKE